MKIKKTLLEFGDVAQKIMQHLGWEGGCNFLISYGVQSENDVQLQFDFREGGIIDVKSISKIQRLLPEADGIEILLNEGTDDTGPPAWLMVTFDG